MNLPEPLEAWSASLAVVARDVALSLGPWLQRLAPAVGPLRARALTGAGEPDGYDGLTRRGTYERLLLSEWLLAEEVPDEFLRRAAMGELGFHRVVRRETAKARTSVALFDAGPAHLGAPRIAHLAVLLLLAQRARDAGARFGWGVLQLPPGALGAGGGLRLDVTPDNVDGLLGARQAMGAGDDDLGAWAELERRGGPWDDLWLVGPSASWDRWVERVPRRAGATGGFVEPRDVLEPDARKLSVRVRQRSTVREVELDLPDPATCVRLLRGPVRNTGRAPPARPHPGSKNRRRGVFSNVLIAPSGSKVIARTDDGALLVFGVPGSSRGGTPRPRIVVPRPGERLLAAGWGARRLVLLSDFDRALRLYDWNGNVFPWQSSERPAGDDARAALLALDDEAWLAELHVHRRTPASPRTASVVDRERRLWSLDREGVLLAAERVDVVGVIHEALTSHGEAEGEAPGPPAFFAGAARGRAEEAAPGEWRLVRAVGGQGDVTTTVPPDARAVGVGGCSASGAPQMLCVERDGVTLAVYVGKERHHAHKSASPILQAAVDPSGQRVAFATDDRGLGVYDLSRREELMRYVPERYG